MDIANLIPTENILEIVHPHNEKILGIRVSLISIEDERMKKIKRQIADERIRLEQRGKSFDSAKIENNLNMMLFAAMTGWEWYAPDGGEHAAFEGNENPPFNQATVFAVFNKLYWFRNQVSERVSDDKSFFQK